MSRSRTEAWIDREASLLMVIHEIVNSLQAEAEKYDTIDLIIDLLASTVIATVEEYLEDEYNDAFSSGLEGWIDEEPDEIARRNIIYAEVDGKTFDERIAEYAAAGFDGFEASVKALVSTDGHRVRSEGTLDAGAALGSAGLTVTKTWGIIPDGKTRDAHYRLSGVTIPYEEYFEIDGFKALAPGLFGVAELDCNCRCWLTLGVTE